MDQDAKDIVETVNFIKDYIIANMATKAEMNEGFAVIRNEMNEGFEGVRTELVDIKSRLKELEASVGNHAGYGKEIDHALERIAAIERHLGIKQGAAA